MKEHEVFAALCFMSSSKDHLIESKSSWEMTCSVFIRLLKNYCVIKSRNNNYQNPNIIDFFSLFLKKPSYEIISKYATDSLETIFNEWYWWIFDCLSFEYLVKNDCLMQLLN